MADLSDLPTTLQRLIGELTRALGRGMARLRSALSGVGAWQRQTESLLTRYHLAAFMAGQGRATLTRQALTAVTRDVRRQLGYLDGFAKVVQSADTFESAWVSRAESYAEAIQVPYWRGATGLLPLPAMPGEATECLNHCRCLWQIVPVDEAAGDFECFWRRHAKDSCRTCQERARLWNPLLIRGGRLVL